MKRLLCIAGVVLVLVSGASAQAAFEAQPLRGTVSYPQGSAEGAARFSYRYRLPQFTEELPQAAAVNAYFAAYANDLLSVGIPAAAGGLDSLPAAGEPEYYVDLDYDITAYDPQTLSVVLVSQRFLGNVLTETYDSAVFALDGLYAGQRLTLTQAMGLEQETGDANVAAELAYGLVWQIVQYEIAAMQKAYFPGVTQEEFRAAFSPERDFYFDADGNFVFYIQAGLIAAEVEGVLTFPFSLAELLSAVTQG